MFHHLMVLAFAIVAVGHGAAAVGKSTSSVYVGIAAQGRSSIGGMVTDSSRRPIENIRVELLDEVDGLIATVRTSSTGRYNFGGLSSGVFQVKVMPFGTDYEGRTERVSIGGARVGLGSQNEMLDFVLRLRTGTARPTAPPGTVFIQQVPDDVRKIYEAAVRDLALEGGAERAIAALQRAVELFPRYFMALELLGTERVKRGQYDAAIPTLAAAIEVNPRAQMSFYALGIAQYYLKQPAAALESLKRSVALAPNSVNSQFWLGIVLFREGKIAEAEVPLTRARELGGKSVPDVHMYLAQVYSSTKRYGEAADELDTYLREVPNARDAAALRSLVAELRNKARQTASR